MKVLITGVCGFAGSSFARIFRERIEGLQLFGIDNLVRRGSETNLPLMRQVDCAFTHGDIRNDEDVSELPRVDWIVDCAANPSVLAGISGGVRQVVAHNLGGTLNLLEKARRDGAGFVMLSSSRVYSIEALNRISLTSAQNRFNVPDNAELPPGMTRAGISEAFSTTPPVSIYGATKLASETMALEYGSTYGFPVRINRCGVIAGPGQFGRPDQGVFSYWIYRWMHRKPLRYIGFEGRGFQVRDLVAPSDLGALVVTQLSRPETRVPRIINVGGGIERSLSLAQLSEFCRREFGPGNVEASGETRPFDIPYYVTDNSLAAEVWGWLPEEPVERTLSDIVAWARRHESELASFAD
jgi:CDP-paratose 2-epimerase